jgi:hypothetical protein
LGKSHIIAFFLDIANTPGWLFNAAKKEEGDGSNPFPPPLQKIKGEKTKR